MCHNFGWEAIFKVQCKISGLGGKNGPKPVGEKMGSKLLLRLIPRSTRYFVPLLGDMDFTREDKNDIIQGDGITIKNV